MLSVPAFNALLKILEEPPDHVKFVFATTEPNKVIPTIQSRCQRFDFSNIGPTKIAEQLKFILEQEKIKYQEDLVLLLAKMANGSMRDGLSLLDRLISTGVEPLSVSLLEEFLGQPNSEKIWNLIGQIGDSNAAGTLAAIEDLISTGISEVQIVDSLIDYMRDLMVVKSAGADSELLILTAEQRKRTAQLAEKFDTAALIYNITALEKLRWAIKNSDTPRALLEALLLRFTLSEHFLNVDELLLQSQAGPIKKKQPTGVKSKASTEARGTKEDRGQKTEDRSQAKSNEHRATSPVRNLPMGTGNTTQKGKISNGASNERRGKTRGQRKNEIINDPAVKAILMGLDATITGIEEEPQKQNN